MVDHDVRDPGAHQVQVSEHVIRFRRGAVALGEIGQAVGECLGDENIACSDIGGTSFDVALITKGSFAIKSDPDMARLVLSLPLVAMDGTMRRRLHKTPLVGQARIKTGTLNNVRAIAGYSRDSNGNSWAVVAILNDPRPWGASSILDQVLIDLYKQPKLSAQR